MKDNHLDSDNYFKYELRLNPMPESREVRVKLNMDQLSIILELSDDKGHAPWKLAEHSERNIESIFKSLERLEKKNLIYMGPRRKTTRSKSPQPNKTESPYYIREGFFEFTSIVNQIIEKDKGTYPKLKKFLMSEYTNSSIEKYGFKNIYLFFEKYLSRPDLRRSFTKSLMNTDATRKEFEDFITSLSEFLLLDDIKSSKIEKFVSQSDIYDVDPSLEKLISRVAFDSILNKKNKRTRQILKMKHKLLPISLENLEILGRLDPIEAVEFYRKNIHDRMAEIYESLISKSRITEELGKFMVLDNYLSPITSYPTNGPMQILFLKPFQRIYENTYILDEKDIEIFAERAEVVYNNFNSFLFYFFDFLADSPEFYQNMENITKRLIFYWNVNSSIFDHVLTSLRRDYNKGSGKYFINNDGLSVKIIDMENNQQLLPVEIPKTWQLNNLCPHIPQKLEPGEKYALMDDPFIVIRPCEHLLIKSSNLGFISIDAVLSNLRSELAGHKT